VVSLGTAIERGVVLTNRGTAPVTLTSLEVSGADANRFSLLPPAPTQLAVGASVPVRLTFVPVRTGHTRRG